MRHMFLSLSTTFCAEIEWGSGLRPDQGRVGSREAMRRHGSFSYVCRVLIPLNINFLHTRHCEIRQVDKMDFLNICPSESRVHALNHPKRGNCIFFF